MQSVNRRTVLKLLGALGTAPIIRPISVFAAQPDATLALINGRIITIDASDSTAEAIAIRGDRILAVGPTAHIKSFIGRETRVIDLLGKTVTPGLIDAHAHLPPFGSRELLWVNLQGVPAKERILELIAARAATTPAGTFINAWGVESNDLAFLNRHDLDSVTTQHPVLVVHTTGQWGFANSTALKRAGITQATPDPPGSLIDKEPDGQPTGLLLHYPALYLVRKVMPPPGRDLMTRVISHAATLYCQEGVTCVHDNFFMVTGMSSVESARLYFDLAASGRLPVRVKIWPYLPSLADTRDAAAELFTGTRPNHSSPFYELGEMKRSDPASFSRVWGGLKIAIDGSGPSAGWSRNPRALMLHSAEDLHQMVDIIHRAGQQTSVHAVGDRAVETMLDAFEAARKSYPRTDARHRIEHAIMPSDASFRRIRKAGIIISTHPQFIYAWGDRWAGARKQNFIPLRSLLDYEVPVALGADPPAFPLWQPQYALWQATARTSRGGMSFAPDEAVTIRQALRMHTMGSAYAAFQERDLGSLEKGKYADLVVWDRNFLEIPTGEIPDAKALITVVRGEIMYARDPGIKTAR